MADQVEYREHPVANTERLAGAVREMELQVSHLQGEVVAVNSQVEGLEQAFQRFMGEFRAYVEQDRKDRRLHEAMEDRVILQNTL